MPREEWRRSRQGKKVDDGRCGDQSENEPSEIVLRSDQPNRGRELGVMVENIRMKCPGRFGMCPRHRHVRLTSLSILDKVGETAKLPPCKGGRRLLVQRCGKANDQNGIRPQDGVLGRVDDGSPSRFRPTLRGDSVSATAGQINRCPRTPPRLPFGGPQAAIEQGVCRDRRAPLRPAILALVGRSSGLGGDSLTLQVVEVSNGALGVGGSREDEALVVAQHL